MKQGILLASLAITAMLVNIIGIIREDFLLRKTGEVLFFLPLILYYLRKIPFKNFNFLMFLGMALVATIISYFERVWYFEEIKLGLWLVGYVFLAREAIKHTEYEKGNRFTNLYFVGVIGAYVYLLWGHVSE